jgi:hypothetical protein
MSFRSLLSPSILVLLAGTAAAHPRTVDVDCRRGESIGAALRRRGNPLTIEIRGICRENVVVDRSDVLLQGADPASDGIRADLDTLPALLVRDARAVQVRRLSLFGGSPALWLDRAVADLEDLTVTGAAARGGIRADGSRASLRRVTVTRNAFRGVDSLGSWLLFRDSAITDNLSPDGGEGIVTQLSGHTGIVNCSVTGSTALVAVGGSEVTGNDSTIEGGLDPARPLRAISVSNGQVALSRGSVAGPLDLRYQGRLTLLGTDQLSAGADNVVDTGALLHVVQAQLSGRTRLTNFGRAAFSAGSVPASLSCEGGAEAYCPDSVTGVPVSTCGLCPARP